MSIRRVFQIATFVFALALTMSVPATAVNAGGCDPVSTGGFC